MTESTFQDEWNYVNKRGDLIELVKLSETLWTVACWKDADPGFGSDYKCHWLLKFADETEAREEYERWRD